MTTPEPDADGLLIQAEKCPLIRGAYATEDTAVIARTEKYHPPERCIHVKQAAEAEAARKAEKETAK